MPIPRQLKRLDPTVFRNRHVLIQRDLNNVNIVPHGKEMDFHGMKRLRRAVDYRTIGEALDARGYLFANLGLSIYATTAIKGRVYLVVTTRPDSARKLISGYIHSDDLEKPVDALREELAEEVLIYGQDNRVLPGFLANEPLTRPYEKLTYAEDRRFDVNFRAGPPEIDDLDKRTVLIDGSRIVGEPKIYYDAATDSAQLVFGTCMVTGLEQQPPPNRLTLGYVEDVFHPETEELWAEVSDEGMLLIRLEDGVLTEEIYTYRSGKLKKMKMRPGKFRLSEAFLPKDDGVTTSGETSITLARYLEGLRL